MIKEARILEEFNTTFIADTLCTYSRKDRLEALEEIGEKLGVATNIDVTYSMTKVPNCIFKMDFNNRNLKMLKIDMLEVPYIDKYLVLANKNSCKLLYNAVVKKDGSSVIVGNTKIHCEASFSINDIWEIYRIAENSIIDFSLEAILKDKLEQFKNLK